MAYRSQSTIKMEKGYYHYLICIAFEGDCVAIHNKNGKGLLLNAIEPLVNSLAVAIHNKNGKGLLREYLLVQITVAYVSQSTIKMEKGYYSG